MGLLKVLEVMKTTNNTSITRCALEKMDKIKEKGIAAMKDPQVNRSFVRCIRRQLEETDELSYGAGDVLDDDQPGPSGTKKRGQTASPAVMADPVMTVNPATEKQPAKKTKKKKKKAIKCTTPDEDDDDDYDADYDPTSFHGLSEPTRRSTCNQVSHQEHLCLSLC